MGYTLPGVTVLKGQEEIEVRAPVVISNAGIFNTFQKFLPQEIQDKAGRIQHRWQSNNNLANLFFILFPQTLFSMQKFNLCWVRCVTEWVLSWSSLVWMDPKRSWALFQLTSGCIKATIQIHCKFLMFPLSFVESFKWLNDSNGVNFFVSRMESYFSLSREEVLGNIPMMFITFPSAKDPTANIRHPGNTVKHMQHLHNG